MFKVDVVIYPEVLFNLAPAIEVSFWKGMRLTAQLEVPIYNDGYPDMYNKIHPGFIGVSQTVRLPYNIWGTLTVGHFSSERYGVDMKISHRFIRESKDVLDIQERHTGMDLLATLEHRKK